MLCFIYELLNYANINYKSNKKEFGVMYSLIAALKTFKYYEISDCGIDGK